MIGRTAAAVALALVAGVGCSGSSGSSGSSETTRATPDRAPARTTAGTANVDGRPFDSRWIGAVVQRDDLITPCQAELPPVRDGRFRVTVFGATQAGCGGAGTAVRFWTYVNDVQLFNDRWVPWAGLDRPLTLAFSTADPDASLPGRTEISGQAFDLGGRPVPIGTRITARVGTTTCGAASVRSGGGFRGFILNIVGADSIPTCVDGAPITFLIGRTPAEQTGVNGQSQRELLRLTPSTPASP